MNVSDSALDTFQPHVFWPKKFGKKVACVLTLLLLVARKVVLHCPLDHPTTVVETKIDFWGPSVALDIFLTFRTLGRNDSTIIDWFFFVSPIFLNVFIKPSFLIVFSVTVATSKGNYFFVIQGRFYWKFLVRPRNDKASTKLFSKSMLHICWLLRQIKLRDKH